MSDDIYDEHLYVLQDNEIQPSANPLLHAPDAVALGGPTWHQGVDYGLPDTTVAVVDGYQCVHDGVAYYGGESADVPAVVAQHWVRSGWATTESDGQVDLDAEADSDRDADANPGAASPPVKSTTSRRQTAPGTRRRG